MLSHLEMNRTQLPILHLIFIFVLINSCTENDISKEKLKSLSDSNEVIYDIQIRRPNFKPNSTASQTMYSTDKVDRILIEDFKNIKTNRYSLIEQQQIYSGSGSYYKPEIIYRNIEYFEDRNKNVQKSIKVARNIRWHLKEFSEVYKPMETMVVDKNGLYTFENMPPRFANSTSGTERVVVTRVAELGNMEEEPRYFNDIIKAYRLKYENQRIVIHRKKGFDLPKFLNDTGLNKFDLMIRER